MASEHTCTNFLAYMQLPPLSIEEVRALRLKLRQERKQRELEEQQQRGGEAMPTQHSTVATPAAQHRT